MTSFARFGACGLLLAIAIGAAAAAGGCEAIVNGDVPAYTCSMQPYVNAGSGACPSGQYCKGSGCSTCEDKDICDGYDNDCNGKIDDGPYSDHDGDGYTFCGVVDSSSGKLTNVDCDDNDPAIHPGAPEICNGKDDDCNGIIDDPGVACPTNETCVPKTEQCVSTSLTCAQTGCPQGMICDTATNTCVQPDQDAGSACTGDKACASGICGDPSELGPGLPHNACTKPCCTSADCDPDSVCLGAGTGGNYCVQASLISRPPPGPGQPGATCGRPSDCRSSVCTNNKCQDTCCGDVNCTNGTTCSYATFGAAQTLSCVPPPGSVATNKDCNVDSDCVSGFCAVYHDNLGDTFHECATPCCSSHQCGVLTIDIGFGQQITAQLVCFDDVGVGKTGVVPVCDAPKQGNGNGNVGDPCQKNGDCFSDRCDTTNHVCTDVCCQDADCGKAGFVCRPTQVGTGTYLRCVPVQ